jgi:predicted transcriptional regulator
MPVQATTAVPAPLVPRSAGGQESSPCTGTAIPVLNGFAGTPGRFSGIRRVYPKNVLDHPERAAVYTTIVARPGIDITGIAAELGMNRETLRYHLSQLESAVRIVVLRDRGIVRYFENHGRYTLLERKVLQHLWNPTAKEVLSLVAGNPGITPSAIAARLAITPPTVRWYIQRFCADGIVTGQHEGKYTRYSMVPEAGGFVPVGTSTSQGVSLCLGGNAL